MSTNRRHRAVEISMKEVPHNARTKGTTRTKSKNQKSQKTFLQADGLCI